MISGWHLVHRAGAELEIRREREVNTHMEFFTKFVVRNSIKVLSISVLRREGRLMAAWEVLSGVHGHVPRRHLGVQARFYIDVRGTVLTHGEYP